MNYKKQLFFNYRQQCKLAYESKLNPYTLKLGGNVTINFVWTEDTKYTYECMVIVYHNKPLVQRISSSHLFTDEALYRLVREAERYALNNS
jgi:hypothetical protein